jgi:hypothetical protein
MVLLWSISILEVLECSLYEHLLYKAASTLHSYRWLVGAITVRSNTYTAGGIGTVKLVLETSSWQG